VEKRSYDLRDYRTVPKEINTAGKAQRAMCGKTIPQRRIEKSFIEKTATICAYKKFVYFGKI
jgi:hypothetical protein